MPQVPDERVAWHNTSGPMNAGVVTFDKVVEGCTRVTLRMAYAPETTGERLGTRWATSRWKRIAT